MNITKSLFSVIILFFCFFGAVISQSKTEIDFLRNSGYDKCDSVDDFGTVFFCRNRSTEKWEVISILKSSDQGGYFLNSLSKEKFDKIEVYTDRTGYKKQYFFFLNGKIGYKEIGYFNFETSLDDLRFEYDEIVAESSNYEYHLTFEYSDILCVRKGNLWGLNDMWENRNLIPCLFIERKDVPFQYALKSSDYVKELQQRFKADLVLVLKGDYTKTIQGNEYEPEHLGRFIMIRKLNSQLWIIYDSYTNEKISELEFMDAEYVRFGSTEHALLAMYSCKWGMIELENKYIISEFVHPEKQDVPMVYLSKQQFEYKEMLRKRGIDQLIYDSINEDGVVKVRNAKTGKWGMYQIWSAREVHEKIPMQYDSLDFFGFNARMTGVWNNGKVGIYLSPWSFSEEDARQTVNCLYDDYKIYYLQDKSNPYLAVKKDGLWAWIDWMTGEMKTEFIYDLEKEQMPYPLFEQND